MRQDAQLRPGTCKIAEKQCRAIGHDYVPGIAEQADLPQKIEIFRIDDHETARRSRSLDGPAVDELSMQGFLAGEKHPLGTVARRKRLVDAAANFVNNGCEPRRGDGIEVGKKSI